MSNLATVQDIYAAFGRGDVPAILATLADDVEWEYGVTSTDVPWLQPRRGRDAVVGFFQALAGLQITHFAPTAILESGTLVVAVIQLEGTVPATGRVVSEVDEVHVWHFDAAGKVAKFRHRADTHQHHVAFHGQ